MEEGSFQKEVIKKKYRTEGAGWWPKLQEAVLQLVFGRPSVVKKSRWKEIVCLVYEMGTKLDSGKIFGVRNDL